jgi:hypothetical protein
MTGDENLAREWFGASCQPGQSAEAGKSMMTTLRAFQQRTPKFDL